MKNTKCYPYILTWGVSKYVKGRSPLFNPVGIRVQRGKKNAVLRDQSFQVVDSPSSFTRMPCASEFI